MKDTLKKTALNEICRKYGGKMVDFHGWELPIQFEGIMKEHEAVRNSVGIFDVSHMGQIFLTGSNAFKLIQKLNTNDFRKATVGRGIYSHLSNEKGGVVDDIIGFCLALNRYLAIVNAGTIGKDFKWFKTHAEKMDVEALNSSDDFSMLALQGPDAGKVMEKFSPEAAKLVRFGIMETEFRGKKGYISRTGYTGEDGFEIMAADSEISGIWEKLMEAGKEFGIKPCGLGARDTLRLESGYLLYGQDIDEEHSTLEAGYGWAVCFEKGDFLGRNALEEQKKNGIKRKLTGIILTERGVPRNGCGVYLEGRKIGELTSATFSPTLRKGIGMGYLSETALKPGTEVEVEIHSGRAKARTTGIPFYRGGAFAK